MSYVYTYDKLYLNFKIYCVTHWWLILKEIGMSFISLKDEKNIVEDAISRLDIVMNDDDENNDDTNKPCVHYMLENLESTKMI